MTKEQKLRHEGLIFLPDEAFRSVVRGVIILTSFGLSCMYAFDGTNDAMEPRIQKCHIHGNEKLFNRRASDADCLPDLPII